MGQSSCHEPGWSASNRPTDSRPAELNDDVLPKIVLNRMAKRAFGPGPSQAEAEKALGRKVDGAITSDWEAAACSANLGGPISHHRPRSKIVRDVAALVDGLALKRTATTNAAKAEPGKPQPGRSVA